MKPAAAPAHAKPAEPALNAAMPRTDAELDCKGLLCPLPVYQTAQAIGRLQAGQTLRIECTDRGSLEDFPAFARQRGHSLLAAEDRGAVQVFVIRKEGGNTEGRKNGRTE
jgi:tRNA 2-thiouridine synthesizing protein A